MSRALGLDVGSKTIGLALSDDLGLAAHPLEKLGRRGTASDVEAIASRAREAGVTRIVVGLPLQLDGSEGHRARRVRVLIDALRARLGEEPPIETWDERFSTVEANRVLLAADLSRVRRKQVIDKQAASVILQGWLDYQLSRQAPDEEG